jgi:hypothetical protein
LEIANACHAGGGRFGMLAARLVAAVELLGRRRKKPRSRVIMIGTGPDASAGTVKLASMLTVSFGYAELSTRPIRFFVTVATPPLSPRVVEASLPRHTRDVRRDAPVNFALEVLNNLRPPRRPLIGSRHARAVLHPQHVGHRVRVPVRGRLIESGLILRVRARPNRAHSELLHHVGVIVEPGRDLLSARRSRRQGQRRQQKVIFCFQANHE